MDSNRNTYPKAFRVNRHLENLAKKIEANNICLLLLGKFVAKLRFPQN